MNLSTRLCSLQRTANVAIFSAMMGLFGGCGFGSAEGDGRELHAYAAGVEYHGPPCRDSATIRRWSPKVYLHPYDKHRPQSIQVYRDHGEVFDASGNWLGAAGDLDLSLLGADTYISLKDYVDRGYPTGHDAFETGLSAVAGEMLAPMYVKGMERAEFVDLKYIFFYEFNGFQMFRASFWGKKRNFPFPRFARHEGDWEHITVRLHKSDCSIVGAYYGQHGDQVWYGAGELSFEDGDHPVVYSALNSHASYPRSGTFTEKELPGVGVVVGIMWSKVVDEAARTAGEAESRGLRTYSKPSDFNATVVWRPWAHALDADNPDLLVDLDRESHWSQGIAYCGHFGIARLDNRHMDTPPSLPYNGHNKFFALAKVADFFGALSEYHYGSGPRSPRHQGGGYWYDDEP